MGRKKKKPTKVLSVRIPESEYRRMKCLANKSGKRVSEVWREMMKHGK